MWRVWWRSTATWRRVERQLQLHNVWLSVSRLASSQAESWSRDTLTPSETLGALRPFYLAVHPDLFARFPEEQSRNEESLKQLNSYIDCLEDSRQPQPVNLVFYIHPSIHNNMRGGRLRTVDISLCSFSLGSVVYDILQACDLSEHIGKHVRHKLIDIKVSEKRNRQPATRERPQYSQMYPDWENLFTSCSKTHPTHLDTWLQESLPRAREHVEASDPIRRENSALLQDICTGFGLRGITSVSDWTAVTLRQHLRSLQTLLRQERLLIRNLGEDVTFVLGYRSEVDVQGYVNLNCEDTMQQWIQFLPFAAHQRQKARYSGRLEQDLCSRLGGVQFERPGDVTLDEYCRRMEEYTRESAQYTVTPFSEASSRRITLMVSSSEVSHPKVAPTGTVHVPVSYPLDKLIVFLKESYHQVRCLEDQYQRRKKFTSDTIEQCRKTLNLSELTRHTVVSDENTCQSCYRLQRLLVVPHLLKSLRDQYICLNTYYSVSAEGKIVIPWNFTFSHTVHL